MKLLFVGLVLAVVAVNGQLTQEQIDAMATAPAAYQAVPTPDGNTVEAILGTIIAVLGVLLKVYASWNKKNDAIAQTLIRGIEIAGRTDVKEVVRGLAAEEGQTTFLHKKVQKVTANACDPIPPSPPAGPETDPTKG